jgi:hypothetical protein
LPDPQYPQGFYSGEIVEAAWDIDDDDDMKPVIGFKVKLDDFDEPAWCWHKCYGTRGGDKGPHLEKTKAIVEAIIGSWDSADRISELAPGKRVRVGVYHNTTDRGKVYVNTYIVIGGRRGSSDPEKVATAVSKLTGKLGPTGLPF